MAIGTSNIKLMKSQVLLDTSDGGGQQTSHEVVDGVSNNLFPDVSELDRVYGRVSLRKCYASVVSDDVESYYGAHAIITKRPEDPKVTPVLFTTGDWFDRRPASKDRIERYLARGPKWAGHVLEMQLEGQQAIQQCVRPNDPEPKVGQGLTLTYHEGLNDEREQYVRVTKVTAEARTFTVSGKDIDRKVLTIEISDALRYDFLGPTVSEFELGVNLDNRANLRDTRVANAATYFGISPLALDAMLGDATLRVDNIFTQLVPASQSETAMTDLYASGLSSILVPGAGANKTQALAYANLSSGGKVYLGVAVMPGTFTLTSLSNTITDYSGVLKLGATSVGTIEYDKGLLTFNTSMPTLGGLANISASVTFTPAATPSRSNETASIHVDETNRGNNYTITLTPIPAPGSLVVSYMAQGKVYYLYDTGGGQIKGTDSSFGAGTVSFSTGTVLISLTTLPDANSDILFSWGTAVSTFVRDNITVGAAKYYFLLENKQVTPGTISISWPVGVLTRTATDNGAGGFTGDATGKVNYATGEITLTPTSLPANGTIFTVDYQSGPANEQTFVAPVRDGDGHITVVLDDYGGSIIHGSVMLEFNVDVLSGSELYDAYTTQKLVPPPSNYGRSANVRFHDHYLSGSLGTWIFPNGVNQVIYPGNVEAQSGTINYDTRTLQFLPEIVVPTPIPVVTAELYAPGTPGTDWNQVNAGYKPTTYQLVNLAGIMPVSGVVKVRWRTDSDDSAHSEEFTAESIRFDLTPGYAEDIVPGSVRFKVGSYVYQDRNGSLYRNIATTTGSGVFAGTIQYQTGIVELTSWEAAAANSLTLIGMTTELGISLASTAVFRVPIVPVRPSSIQIRATPVDSDADGAPWTATLDGTGNVTTANVKATADYTSGMVSMHFGAEIEITSGNRATIEAQPWYRLDQEYERSGHTYIFQPKPVYTDSIRYNAVGFTYIPLSADILGLDPVRLPADGRVPIFRVGTVAVIHQTEQLEWATPTIGETFDTEHVRCSRIRLIDSLGAYLPESMHTNDLDAGTVTLGGSFSMTGYTAPLYAQYTIEDMVLVVDVQINGTLGLNKPLTHDYDAALTNVSAALLIQDLQARAFNIFSQTTWTNVWSDDVIGSTPIAQYNDVDYPFTVTNKGALEEDWAIIFTSTTNFRVVGKNIGQIALGDINTDLAPMNAQWGVPYFSINKLGWGSGWAAGNVLRFKTAAANYPIWIARTVLQGDPTVLRDKFEVQIRGDVNTD